MRIFAMLVTGFLALIALSMGALMVSDGLVSRGLLTIAAGSLPAYGLREMYRNRASDRHVA
jgi:hypothetical protein